VPELDHGDPGDAPSAPPPLVAVGAVARRSVAEEARTLVASTNQATLATLTVDGDPWASFVTYGTLDDGSPVLCVSRLAEHGRNLDADPRASLAIVQPDPPADPLASARVTLAGVARRPEGGALAAAREAHLAGVPAARYYIHYSDFSLWVLDVQRVRWVGGYGRMDSADGESYAAAVPDPIATVAPGAVAHLNADHADALLAMARALGGYPDATAATCTAADRFGLDLSVDTPRGRATSRIGYAEPLQAASELREATVQLARRARDGG
jgi:putative heme iron utilization protein